ncbi:DUF3617 family protein [Pseudomonas batumici]|uniref:DUF3617 domain-containing protein n=1 Tax=Pseudomonas batumici TaxID=226910 RepID=UPI0030D45FFE
MWQDEAHYALNGRAIPSAPGAAQCLSASDAKDIRATLERRLKSDQTGCKITSWNNVGTKVNVALACTNPQGTAIANISGTATQTAYDLKGTSQGQGAQTGAYVVDIHLQGKRVGSCN